MQSMEHKVDGMWVITLSIAHVETLKYNDFNPGTQLILSWTPQHVSVIEWGYANLRTEESWSISASLVTKY